MSVRAYVIPANVTYSDVIYPGPCILDAMFVTSLGTTTYAWTLFDGLQPGTTVLSMGTLVPVSMSQMDLKIHSGLFFQEFLGGVNAGWTFLIRTMDDDS
jgi:hypothetical protein